GPSISDRGRSSGFRIVRTAASSHGTCSHRSIAAVTSSALVPGYSGGTATESHRLPYSPGDGSPGTSDDCMLKRDGRMSTLTLVGKERPRQFNGLQCPPA